MPTQHACQPLALFGDRQMPAALQLVVDLVKLGPHPFLDRDAPQPELSAPALPADVREAQEIERFGLAEPTLRPVLAGEPPELDEACLVGVQLQGELREPLAEVPEELFGVTLMLEPDHEVVRPAHDDHVTAGVTVPPSPSPPV